jgi:hypothetical protein
MSFMCSAIIACRSCGVFALIICVCISLHIAIVSIDPIEFCDAWDRCDGSVAQPATVIVTNTAAASIDGRNSDFMITS